MESDITSGTSANQGKGILYELEETANRLRTEFLAMPQTYTQPTGLSSLAWAAVEISQPTNQSLREARRRKSGNEYDVRELVRMTHTMIVVFAKYLAEGDYEDNKWAVTASKTSEFFRFWMKANHEMSPNLPIPLMPKGFSFTPQEIREYYTHLKESNHEDYRRWDSVKESDLDHPKIKRVLAYKDIAPPPRWNDLPVHRMGAGQEKVPEVEPKGWERAIGKVSGWFEESS